MSSNQKEIGNSTKNDIIIEHACQFRVNIRTPDRWEFDFGKFAEMIQKHGDGIAAYRKPENKASSGFVEGIHNKFRVIQGRAYSLRVEGYLRLENSYLYATRDIKMHNFTHSLT